MICCNSFKLDLALSMSSQRCPWEWSTMTSPSKDELTRFSVSAEQRLISRTNRTSRSKEIPRNQVLLKSENNSFHGSVGSKRLKMLLGLSLSCKIKNGSIAFLMLGWNPQGNTPKWKQWVQICVGVTDKKFQVLFCTCSIKQDRIY